MRLAFARCLLGMVLLVNAEAVKETTTPSLKSTPEETRSVGAIEPIITSAPQRADIELKQRADNDNSGLIGYYSISGYWYSMECDSTKYFVGGDTIGACCNNGEPTCNYATACQGNEVLEKNGGKVSCGGDLSICDTLTLFQSSGNPASGVWSIVECFGASGFYEFPRTLYRNRFALTTSQTASTKTDTATVTATVTVSRGPATSLRGREIEGLWICVLPLLMGIFGIWLI